MAYFHFNNKIYNISENEFQSTINFIQENENKLKSEGINELETHLILSFILRVVLMIRRIVFL